jgi:hypothetical protein
MQQRGKPPLSLDPLSNTYVLFVPFVADYVAKRN